MNDFFVFFCATRELEKEKWEGESENSCYHYHVPYKREMAASGRKEKRMKTSVFLLDVFELLVIDQLHTHTNGVDM